MRTENISTLKIHKLTQAQYDRELAAGNINENELYLTPEEEIDLSNYELITPADIDLICGEIEQLVFHINDNYYTFEEGMTWRQWCNSEWNEANFTVNYPYICSSDGMYIASGVCVISSDTIKDYKDYLLVSDSSYGEGAGPM
jgi:hypothetical protein